MELESIVKQLRQSPLFTLSLAAKELFHSNLLAWLCETYPEHVGKFFARFIVNEDVPHKFDRVKAYRERNNIDLTLEYENGQQLIIENKVKSLPTVEQLQRISDGVKEKDSEKTSFLLLTLFRPSCVTEADGIIQLNDGNVIWPHITYRQLGKVLEALVPCIAAVNSYHGGCSRTMWTSF